MLSSITPLGERGRARRWGVTTTAYAVASVAAGALLGAVLGLVPAPGGRAPLVVLAVICVAAAALDLRPTLLPTVRRQVNEDWLHTYRGWVYGAGFGAQLGLGVVTIVTTAAVYATLAAAALSGSPWAGAAIGAVFGLVRALPALLTWRVTTVARLAALSRRIDELATVARRSAVGALLAASVAAGALAVAA
jgi:sulfite exporter TauE/SafE